METILLSKNDMYKGSLIWVNAIHPLPMDSQPEVLMNISNTFSSPMYLENTAGTVLMENIVVGFTMTLWRSVYGS